MARRTVPSPPSPTSRSALAAIASGVTATAVALVFSTFTTPTLSAIFTLSIYVIGHLTGDLKALGAKLEGSGRLFLTGLYYLMPNLENFSIQGRVIHHLEISGTDLALIFAYGLLYITLLLLLASVIFQRRDFR